MEFTKFQERCLSLIEASNCRGRHSIRCAVNHLRRGWEIRKVDAEMAAFRGITAEEEAASGLFHALKYRGYKNSGLLKPRNHIHKSAVTPFLQVLGAFFNEFSETRKVKPRLHIKEEADVTGLHIALSVFVNGKDHWAYPVPPLNFSVTSDGKPPSYKKQIERFLTAQNASNILSYVKEQANERNQLLYAGPDGYPVISELKEEFFALRQRRIMAMAIAYLLIEPYDEIQPFVQNALDSFLVMLQKVENEFLHTEF